MGNSLTGKKVVLAIHGGTGMARAQLTSGREAEYRDGLHQALRAGLAIGRAGGTSLDMVEAAVRSLEDCPLFNAGRGSVFNREGFIEMDAAIMDGATGRGGAVTLITTLKNPVSAARAVMEKSPHVFLGGPAAEAFAAAHGLERVDREYFWTERRWEDLQKALAKEKGTHREFGTVGAVALDARGNLAAATSTGGMTAKFPGRIGDTPVLGAGTYADNRACAVSGTGHGEFFIRYAVGHDVAARMLHRGETVAEAARAVIEGAFAQAGGEGGVIALDAQGRVAMPYNSPGLYRGFAAEDGEIAVNLYED